MCPSRRKMNASILIRTQRSMGCLSASIIVSAADGGGHCFDETHPLSFIAVQLS